MNFVAGGQATRYYEEPGIRARTARAHTVRCFCQVLVAVLHALGGRSAC